MKKFFKFSWLPIVAAAIIVSFYGGALISQNQRHNQLLVSKIDQLTNQVNTLKGELEQNSKEVAGTSTLNLQKAKVAAKTMQKSSPTPTPTPTPTKISIAPVSTSTPTSTPTTPPTPTPTPSPVAQVAVDIQNQGNYNVDVQSGDTAFSVLLRAGGDNGFSIEYQDYGSMGIMVNCIGGVCSHDNFYWAFYNDGAYAQVGASSQMVSAGDTTSWKFESF